MNWGNKNPLDPDKPVTISLWHYYNGHIKEEFDTLVNQFNESMGVEEGIVIDAKSLGDVQQLADAVYDAANNTIGSQPLPDIFMAYPENAFRVNQVVGLVDLVEYFSSKELERYRKEFIEEGRFGSDNKLRILPFAKSTENLFINKTFWDEFASENGLKDDQLSTWEGIVEVAQKYYNKKGKAFLGIDANANYMLLSSMQLGNEMFNYEGDKVVFNFNEIVAKKIWDYYYVPYINGYFEKSGRFSSDDARTGNVLAYTGSTAGAAYFPAEVTLEGNSIYKIEPLTLPYPYFEIGNPYAIQQGAGMCITKSDRSHEYASSVFLKWFTEPKQNIEFAVTTGYLPVMNESLNKENLLEQLNGEDSSSKAINSMIDSTINMLDSYTLYSSKPFEGSYDMRLLLENNLYSKIQKDLVSLEQNVQDGGDRKETIQSLTSEDQFKIWYQQIIKEASLILGEEKG